MKKILAIALSVVMLLSLGVVFASATPGYYCGGSEENFAPVGKIQIQYDSDAASKLDVTDGDMQDWVDAGYNTVSIGAENMISWVGGTADNQAAGMPEGWGIQTYFVADADFLYIGFYITDPEVVLVQSAENYTAGDSFQFMVDFDRALGKIIDQDPDLFANPKCIFYSFGPMGEEATPIQIMRQESDGNDGVISEANGDGIKGATALTENGWCAEFAFNWNQLYDDFEYKAYADDYECSVTEGDPLEVCCALYYLNSGTITNEDGSTSIGMTWAAGTLTAPEAGTTPDVTWTPVDNGIELYVEYDENLVFNCDRIIVYKIGETAPPQTEAPTEEPTEAPETEAPTEEPTEAPTEEATQGGEAGTKAPEAETKAPEKKGGCGSVIGSVAVLFSAMAAAVVLKKKD